MSPRRTQRLHQLGDRTHFFSVSLVSVEGGHLGGELGTAAKPIR
jgi:deoxyxylulose-5-phosphate synthase